MTYRRALLLVFTSLAFLALNTGANLVTLLAAFLAATMLLERRRLAAAAADLVLTREILPRYEEGTPGRVRLAVTNRSDRRTHPLVRLTVGPAGESREFWAAGLAPGATARFAYDASFPRRGLAPFPPPMLSLPGAFEIARPLDSCGGRGSGAPAYPASAATENSGPVDVALVHPRAAEITISNETLGLIAGDRRAGPPGDDDFAGLARAEEGERPSRIHWPAYARTGEIHRKDFRDRASERALVLVVACDPARVDAAARAGAGCARRLREAGIAFELATCGDRLSGRIPGEDERATLDHLALFLPGSTSAPVLSAPPRLAQLVRESGAARCLLVLPEELAWDEAALAAGAPGVVVARVAY